MTDAEIDAAEARLGITLPDEARVLYRVMREWTWDLFSSDIDLEDHWHTKPVPFDVLALDSPRRNEPRASADWGWWFLAPTAGTTTPNSAVQALSKPPEWFVIGTYDHFHVAIDMVPGPRGKVGQIIGWTDETRGDQPFGAEVLADSLLDFAQLRRENGERATYWTENLPAYGKVTQVNGLDIEDVTSPELEVLYIRRRLDNKASIAPVVGSPRLRAVMAGPGAISDPLEIGKLATLEYLELGVAEWRALLDADAVPRSLMACRVEAGPGADRHDVADVKERLARLWGLAPAEQKLTIRGHLA